MVLRVLQTIDVTIDELLQQVGKFSMHSESHADSLTTGQLNAQTLNTITISGYLGSAQVTLAADATDVNTSVRKVAADVKAVKNSTGVEATAITKGKIDQVSAIGTISFDLAGNQKNTEAPTFYDVTATLAATTDLDPLVDAINAHAYRCYCCFRFCR